MLSKPTVLFFAFAISLGGSGAGCKDSKCVEKPIADCVCTMEYDPVCGCNDKTYSNACAAECAGITTYVKGPCADKS